MSRDPDDNLLLATAAAGNAEFLISNDKDILEIAETTARNCHSKSYLPASSSAA